MKKRVKSSAILAGITALVVAFNVPSMAIASENMSVSSHQTYGDTLNASTDLGSGQSVNQNDIPSNPDQKLPDTISDKVPDDSTLVSQKLASDGQGSIYDVETGEKVTDPQLVGTKDTPADPLAKTNGKSFIPVDLSDVKDKIDEESSHEDSLAQSVPQEQNQAQDEQSQATTRTAQSGYSALRIMSANRAVADKAVIGNNSGQNDQKVDSGQKKTEQNAKTDITQDTAAIQNVFLPNNNYGAHWGTYNGTPAFFQNDGRLFVQQAKGVIDVSQWQGDIDWNAVKATGNVQAAIVRIGYGSGNALDRKAARNISELKRLGIPFGVYWYSYSENASQSTEEARSTADALRKLGITNNDLSYPIYYDLEHWTWAGHAPSTDPNVNAAAMHAYFNTLASQGYSKTAVYSYTSYLNSNLRHSDIWKRTTWVAQYGASMGFTAWNTNFRGWQYSSSGKVNGISGNVDINAFGNYEAVSDPQVFDVRNYPLVNLANGEYYINPRLSEKVSVDVSGASRDNGVQMHVYGYNKSNAQRFRFTRNSDGSYTITNVNSGKVLDISAGVARNNARIQQWDSNGSAAQRWYIRNLGNGYALQSALGNWAIDLNGASTANGNPIQLYTPNGSDAQKFFLASVDGPAANTRVKISSTINSSKVLDIDRTSKDNSAQVHVWDWLGGPAQLFTFREVGNGTYSIVNNNSGKVLDVAGNASENGARVDQYDWNNSAAQQWIALKNSDGTYSFQGRGSGKFGELPGGNTNSGTPLKIYSGNGSPAQRWNVRTVSDGDLRDIAYVRQHIGDLPDDTYTFERPDADNIAMEVGAASHANSANVQLYNSNNTKAQQWTISHDGAGYVIVRNVESGKVLDLAGAHAANGQNVQQYEFNDSDAQKWIAVLNSDKTYTLFSKANPNFSLNVSGDKSVAYANVHVWQKNSTVLQKWSLIPTSFVGKHRNDLPNGEFEFLRPNAKLKVLDLAGASRSNGANVQIYDANHSAAQHWVVSHDAKGYVTLTNKASGKVLNLSGGAARNGQNVDQYDSNGTDAQKWVAVRNSDNTVTFYSKVDNSYALDVAGNGTGNSTNVRLYKSNQSTGQKWLINDTDFVSMHEYDIEDGTYKFERPQNSRVVMDLAGASQARGANVRVWASNGTAAQQWRVRHVPGAEGYVVIYNAATGKVLDVSGADPRLGQNVQQWDLNWSKAQQWVAVLNSNGTYTFHSALNFTYVLDVSGNGTANGTNVQLWNENGSQGQQWKVTR
ncbi:RICIN domain-containing protein [Alloscardovia theropitheci]|nr:RICIN domain-containing protein [Alloscardovia theropitheci]